MSTLARRITMLGLALSVAACAVDLRRPPADQWSTGVALTAVRGYQHTLAPLMPRVGVRCRFTPTCSRYAEAVLSGHGLPRGAWLTLRRVARCGPWTKAGTVDPPPGASPASITARTSP